MLNTPIDMLFSSRYADMETSTFVIVFGIGWTLYLSNLIKHQCKFHICIWYFTFRVIGFVHSDTGTSLTGMSRHNSCTEDNFPWLLSALLRTKPEDFDHVSLTTVSLFCQSTMQQFNIVFGSWIFKVKKVYKVYKTKLKKAVCDTVILHTTSFNCPTLGACLCC